MRKNRSDCFAGAKEADITAEAPGNAAGMSCVRGVRGQNRPHGRTDVGK